MSIQKSLRNMLIGTALIASAGTVNATDFTTIPSLDQGQNLSNIDLETLMVSLHTERAETLQLALENQANSVQQTNQKLKDAQTKLSNLRQLQNEVQIDLLKAKPGSSEYAQLEAMNTELETEIANLQTEMDSLDITSQLEMMRLQSLMDKQNQSFDMMTNFIKKFGSSKDSIIGYIL